MTALEMPDLAGFLIDQRREHKSRRPAIESDHVNNAALAASNMRRALPGPSR
jgi:hypothetical protein